MGMDIIGRKPTTRKGEYFRNNVWWWHPLWDYCSFVAPEICEKVTHAHSNDGDGLNEYDSKKLAKSLSASIKNGTADMYISERDKRISKEKSWEASYQLDTENIEMFIKFLRGCGGFNIW